MSQLSALIPLTPQPDQLHDEIENDVPSSTGKPLSRRRGSLPPADESPPLMKRAPLNDIQRRFLQLQARRRANIRS
jgi:hypothetical protein